MIERIIVVKIHFTKEEKQTNKQTKRKRKQAYVRVDLDLYDS